MQGLLNSTFQGGLKMSSLRGESKKKYLRPRFFCVVNSVHRARPEPVFRKIGRSCKLLCNKNIVFL